MPYLKTFTAGPFGTNCYLIGADETDETILIDAPPDCYKEVMRAVEADKRKLTALLITHPHFDHTLDAGLFAADDVPVYSHADAKEEIRRPNTLGFVPHLPESFPEGTAIQTLADGEEIEMAGLNIRCFDAPGHSPASLVFLVPAMGACFSGDVIFNGSIGRTDLPGGDFDVLAESIRNVIYTLSDETILYSGHGPETTVGREKQSNPFVRG